MSKFLVLYCMPAEGLAAWAKTDPVERAEAEATMKTQWDAWLAERTDAVRETYGAGKTKRVTEGSVADVSNDVMLYSIVEAESSDAAAALFTECPHLQIPGAWIDVMPANAITAS